MRRFSSIWFGILLSLPVYAAPRPLPLRFHFETSETSTAIYHLACLAGNIPCTKANFETFWHTTHTWTPADQTELDAWSAILRKVADAALPADPAPYIGNSSAMWPPVAAQHKLIAAALETSNLPGLQSRVWQWVGNDDAARLYTAIVHFRTALHPSGRKEVKELLPKIEKSLHQNGALDLAGQMARFLQADIPTRDVYFHLVPGPIFESDRAKASPVSNHVFMEVTSSAKPVGAASIMLHELTHYFYDNAPARKHLALRQHFAELGGPNASPLYALLNEAIAVAVQAILAESSQSKEDGYRDAFIPRAGRAITPVLRDALAKNQVLFKPEFVDAYIAAATREFGEDVHDLRFVLNSAAFLPTDKAIEGYELFLKEIPPTMYVKGGEWQNFSNENLVFLTAYDEWNSLPESFPELKSYTNKRGFAYLASGNGGRTICVLAGVDSAAIVEVVKAFAKLKTLPPPGLAITVE